MVNIEFPLYQRQRFWKRNTDSIRCAVENDVFGSLPDDSLLDELEMGWADEQ